MEQFQLLHYSGKRPNNTVQALKEEIIEYLKQEVKKSHYPTKRELHNMFHCRINDGIEELYAQAGLKYTQKNSQELKNEKAELLTKITMDILPKLRLDLIEVNNIHAQGVDMIASDKENELIGIELKAHNKHEPIKQRNIQQILRFLKQGFSKIILITTTSKINTSCKYPNVQILDFDRFKMLVDDDQLKILEYIRNQSVHISTEEKEGKRQLIIDYVRKRDIDKRGRLSDDIAKDLRLQIYTYFDSSADLYMKAGLDLSVPMLLRISKEERNEHRKNICKQKAIGIILDYMKKEIKKGRYPSDMDIKCELGVNHIWNYITMTELYKMLGHHPYQTREIRGKSRLKDEMII